MMPERRDARRTARTARAAFAASLRPPLRRALEQALAASIIPHLGPPGTLGSHAALGDEIDPHAVELAAEALGWRLAFPRVTGDGPLFFHAAAYEDLAPGYRNIPEPPETAPVARPDVLLVPLLAADLTGNRLGQGGGHYDRTLAMLRAQGPLLAIGIAWDSQLVDAVAAAPWDQPLDAIATPTAFHLASVGATRRP
jgi:5-formyltetrahydrofolate cyclo-ligase